MKEKKRTSFSPSGRFVLPALLLLFVTIVLLCLRNFYGKDIGFHLRVGEWIAENAHIPTKGMFSFTASNSQYIDLNWLYQITMYSVYRLGGESGLIIINAGLVASTVGINVFRHKSKGGQLDIAFFLFSLVSVLALFPIYEIRPHSYSWLFLTALLLSLEKYTVTRRVKWLFALPLIMLLWVNTHSLFVLGLVCLAVYGLSAILSSGSRNANKNLLVAIAASVLACFINPYFLEGVLYPLRQFQLLGGDNIFNQNISELRSTLSFDPYVFNGQLKLFNQLTYIHLFLVVGLFKLLVNFRKLKVSQWLLLMAFTYVGLSAVKNIGYMVFALFPLISTLRNEEEGSASDKKYVWQWLGILSGMLLVGYLIVNNFFYSSHRTSFSFGVGRDRVELPYGVSEFIGEKKITGPMLNHLNFGGHLMYYTTNKVFIDGRLEVYGEKFYADYLRLFKSGNDGYTKNVLKQYDIKAIVFPYEVAFSWIKYLKHSAEWRLVSVDERSVLYLRKNYLPEVTTLTEEKLRKKYMGEKEFNTSSFQRIVPRSIVSTKHVFPREEKALAIFCYSNDWLDLAREFSVLAIDRATREWPELYFNAGTYFYKSGKKEIASQYYKKFLEEGYHPLAEERYYEVSRH